MGYLEKLEKNRSGWIMYCSECGGYIKQSDPQDFSGGKQVIVVEAQDCDKCVGEAQDLMGRMGLPEKKEGK